MKKMSAASILSDTIIEISHRIPSNQRFISQYF
jgi:hypothetical protein